jgi:hypothetical protein
LNTNWANGVLISLDLDGIGRFGFIIDSKRLAEWLFIAARIVHQVGKLGQWGTKLIELVELAQNLIIKKAPARLLEPDPTTETPNPFS